MAGNSPSETPQPLGLSAVGPQELQNTLGPGREARAAPGPRAPLRPSRHGHLPCSPPCLVLSHPFHHRFLGSKWFPPWPPPPPRGAGAGRGPGHPHHSPGPKATIHVSPVAVCVPRLCSASPLGRPLLFVRLSTLQPLHSSPTNLSWPLSPHFFLPSAPHRNVPGPATGPSAAPSASLCTCLSVSLCPVTSSSFGGADHLFPGCFAAVLRLWRGQNDFDFLIPSAVSLRSLLLPPLFLICVYLSSYFSPLLLPVPARVSTCPRVCPRVCPPVRVRVRVCVRVLCCGLTSGWGTRVSLGGVGCLRVVQARPGSHSRCIICLILGVSVPETAPCFFCFGLS